MAEDEVQYASVVIKSKRQPKAEKEEEVVYDEVKINQIVQQTFDNNVMSDKEEERRCCYQKLAFCFGSLCVILVLTIIGGCVFFVFHHKSNDQELKANKAFLLEEIYNLTNLNNKLSSEFKDQVHNLAQQKQNLNAELSQVKEKNKELQRTKKNLTDQIETMEKTWNEQNISRAQWSIDEYCPKEDNVRECGSCQKAWTPNQSSCYAVNNAEPLNQKTWEEARADCRAKSSDLTVVGDKTEKMFVDGTSWVNNKIKGYWIGLRAAEGKWKWIDGRELTNQDWIQHPVTDGQCVTSHQNQGWKSVSCNQKNAWICEKKTLSV